MGELGQRRIAILRQVAPGGSGVGREQHRAAVRGAADLAVVERAQQVHDVGESRWRVDEIVVPALSGAVVDVLRGGEVGEDRSRPGGIVRAEEPRGRRAGDALAQIHPRLAVGQLRHRKLRAIRIVGAQPRLEHAEGRSTVHRSPGSLVERRRVDDVRVGRVERRVDHAAVRRIAIPDEGEGRAAIGRLEEAERRSRGRRVRYPATSRRDAADTAGRGDVDDIAVPGIDDDRADRAAGEGIARIGAVGWRRQRGDGRREVRPGVAAVRGLVDAHARLRVRRDVRLAGARIERVTAGVGRVDDQRADGIGAETAGDVLPFLGRIGVKRFIGAPDAAAGRRDVEAAFAAVVVLVAVVAAFRRDGHRRDAAGRDVWSGIAEGVQDARNIGLARPDQLPRARGVRLAVHRFPAAFRGKGRFPRHLVGRVRAFQVGLHRRRVVGPSEFAGSEQRLLVAARLQIGDAPLEGETLHRRARHAGSLHGRDGDHRNSDTHRAGGGQAGTREARLRTLDLVHHPHPSAALTRRRSNPSPWRPEASQTPDQPSTSADYDARRRLVKNEVSSRKRVRSSAEGVGLLRASQLLVQGSEARAIGEALTILLSRQRFEIAGGGDHQRLRLGVASLGQQ